MEMIPHGGSFLRGKRMEMKLTASQMAFCLRISEEELAAYEGGESVPGPVDLIAKLLGSALSCVVDQYGRCSLVNVAAARILSGSLSPEPDIPLDSGRAS